MKKFLKVVLWIIGILIAAILIGGLLLPSKTELSVSKEMTAQPEVIFEQVNCLKKNPDWCPWENVSNREFSGPECGKNAVMSWQDDMGGGSMKITESTPYENIKTEMDFKEQGTAKAEFLFEKTESGTKVTRTFEADAAYPVGRWFSFFFIKPMIKDSYLIGLNQLDSLTANMPLPDKTAEVLSEETEGSTILSVRTTCSAEEIPQQMGMIYGKLGEYMQKAGVQPAGAPISIWHSWSDTVNDMEVGFPVIGDLSGEGDISVNSGYSGKVLTLIHYGAYNKVGESWGKLMQYAQENAYEANGPVWEEYLTDPGTEPDTSKWETKLYYPYK